MKNKILAIILAVCLIASVIAVVSFADFGDFGGDNDFGDFGGGGGGWDNDDDGGGYFFGGSSGSGGGGGGLGGAAAVIIVIIVIVIIALVKSKKNPSGASGQRINVGDRSTPDSELRPLTEYSAIDPDFDVADLREKASNLYVRMQNCWTKGDISELRPYFTDALFTQFERQLAQKRAQGLTNYIERISVQNVSVRGFRQESGVDHMIIRLEARIVDYTVDKAGNVVSGAKDREKFMTYEWDMSRTSGVRSLKKDGVGRVFCPACGAPVDINASARCEYCGSVLQSSEHDWAICSIKALSQQTL